MNKIPIRNIYYMVLYAWNKVKDMSNIEDKQIEELESFNDVIIELFIQEVSTILKRGIARDYVNIEEPIKIVKGRIDIAKTIRLIQPNLNCYFDEYSEDIILNQIIKAILIRINGIEAILQSQKKRARNLLLHFSNVELIYLDDTVIRNISFNKLNKIYQYAIDIGMLIYKNSIPTEEQGSYKFIDIMQDEERINIIFEAFLKNFYNIHSKYNVHSRYYYFDWDPIDNSNKALLPRMETDIELTLDDTKIVIDAKYYRNAFTNKFESKKVISNNIYQMKTYLNQNLNKYNTLRGILIYPSNGYELSEKFLSKFGYTMEFRTIDLNMDWKDIETRLMEIVK